MRYDTKAMTSPLVAARVLKRDNWFSHGSVGKDGTCNWVSEVVTEGITYPWAYQNVKALLLVMEVTGEVNLVDEIINVPKLHLNARYNKEYLRDLKSGTLIWTQSAHNCIASVSQLYKGKAWVHKKKKYQGELTDTIVMINNTDTKQYTGLVIRDNRMSCGKSCYTTHIRGLVVCSYVPGTVKAHTDLFKTNGETGLINVQSQIGHLHLATNLQVYEAF
jgi:hypothetical protein